MKGRTEQLGVWNHYGKLNMDRDKKDTKGKNRVTITDTNKSNFLLFKISGNTMSKSY